MRISHEAPPLARARSISQRELAYILCGQESRASRGVS